MRFKWDKRYLHWGVTAFCVIAAGGLCYILLQNWPSVADVFRLLLRIMSPVLYGLSIAYLLYKPALFFEKHLFNRIRPPKRLAKKSSGFSRAAGIVTAILITLIAFGVGLWILLPRVYSSLENLALRLPAYLNVAVQWLQDILDDNPLLEQAVVGMAGNLTLTIRDFIQTSILSRIDIILMTVTSGVFDAIREVINIAIGFAAATYILYNRDSVKAQAKKFVYALFKQKTAENMLLAVGFVDKTCGSYIKARIVDAIIVGIVCYLGMLLLGIPYALLISVLVGITNIIPYFGPFIGGVPAGLLVLLEQPEKCLPFVIFVIILQQLDGNLLYPRIQGSSIGLSGFWIMFAILLFGGLFGFAGLLLGVPVFTVVYYAVGNLIASKLSAKGLPNKIEFYTAPGAVKNSGRSSVDDED